MRTFLNQGDQSLLRAARRDPQAFAAFYDRHEAPLLAFAVRLTRDPELAADVVGEVFATLLEQVARGEKIREPRGWLYTVARRIVIDGARRGVVESAARERLGMEPVALTDDAFERIEQLADDRDGVARAALSQLPREQRLAVQARVLDEQDYDQIGRQLRCSDAVVRKRVSRGLSQIRQRVEETQS